MNKPTNAVGHEAAADEDRRLQEEQKSDQDASGASRRLFDLRVLIAGLLFVYGVLLVGAGLLDTASTLIKADGVRINLWEGIALLIVAGFFGVWRFVDRPR